MSKPTVPDVLPLAKAYYHAHPAGGNLHIVLDDGNIEDSSVQFCLDRAREEGDGPGVELAEMLLKMSKTQRKKLYRTGSYFLPAQMAASRSNEEIAALHGFSIFGRPSWTVKQD